MAKVLECQCGFTAGGPDSTLDELRDVAVTHVKRNHPDLYAEHGDDGIRANTENFVREVAEEGS